MNSWPVQDAKAHFSELLDTCISQGPQLVTRRGVEAAILVPIDEWRRLTSQVQPSLKSLLVSSEGAVELVVPARGTARRRDGMNL
ncbi:MAG: type II toxin-antitoxin system Phd/YefM family antitoxin [Cellvibrio sp.]